MSKFICKCGCSDMIIENKGSQRGMYCKSCGKWQKWATKEDEILISYKTDTCEHCEKGRGICKNRDELGIELHSGSKKLVAYGLDKQNWDISVSCKINYCPMCGKKLGDVD